MDAAPGDSSYGDAADGSVPRKPGLSGDNAVRQDAGHLDNTRGCTVKRWGNRQRRNNAAALDTRQLCTGNATVAGDCSKTYNTDRDGFSKRQRREGRCCYLNPVSVSRDITHDLDRRHAAPGM